MKINVAKTLLIAGTALCFILIIKCVRFSYVGNLYPETATVDTDKNVTITFKPLRPNVAGLTVYVEKSFYTKNANNINLTVTAGTIDDGNECILSKKGLQLSGLPYKGYRKIYLDETLYNPELRHIFFKIDTKEAGERDPYFKIELNNSPISPKDEYPKIIYEDSIGDITREARRVFFANKLFSWFYMFILLSLSLCVTALTVFEPKHQPTTKQGG